MKEATARIKINKLLENAGWRFFPDANGPANIQLEPSVTLTERALDDLGENFERATKGFIDFLLLNEKGFPFIVLEAKSEDKSPLAAHIPIHPDWPLVRLADICEAITDGDHQPPPKASQGVPFVTITNINDDHQLDFTKTFFVPESYYLNLNASRKPRGGDILYTVTGSYGIPVLVPENIRFCFQRHIALIRTGPQLLNRFLVSLLASPFMLQQGHEAATGVAQKTVSLSSLRGFQIPLPPLATQQAIVAEIEAEQALVAANRELISRFEKKIQATLARIWGEDEPTGSQA